MKFDTFARRAEAILAEVPRNFLEGIIGVEAHRRALPHPQIPEIYTLGECADDAIARMAGGDELRSRVHLYHGSFAALAREDPAFDWEVELEETILHEIRHHIEDRAGIRDLLEEDAMFEALSRFASGEKLPSAWYRAGERLEPRVWRIADDLFVELDLRRDDLAELRGRELELMVLEAPLQVEIPDDVELGEILTFEGEGLERPTTGEGDLHLVIRR